MHGGEDGDTGVDDDFAARGFDVIGAWILGRNMFSSLRGPWLDDTWKGWWDDEPPYRCPVFVLTRHVREPVVMRGGTVFHFVTHGIEAALERARAAAGAQDVRLGGGVSLFANLDLPKLGYRCCARAQSAGVTHLQFTRTATSA